MGDTASIFAAINASSQMAKGGLGLAGGFMQASAMREQGEFQARQYESNARIAELEAADAEARGSKEAAQVRRKGEQVQGAQRASFAAQGVDVNSGSAADLQAETAYLTKQDEITVTNNAWREAWGYKVQASNYRGQGAMTRAGARNQAANTILTAGIGALDSFGGAARTLYDMKKGTDKDPIVVKPTTQRRMLSPKRGMGPEE